MPNVGLPIDSPSPHAAQNPGGRERATSPDRMSNDRADGRPGLASNKIWTDSRMGVTLRDVPKELSVDNDALLRRHGLQVTAQRLAVLRAVSDQPHSTAD